MKSQNILSNSIHKVITLLNKVLELVNFCHRDSIFFSPNVTKEVIHYSQFRINK